MHRFFFRWIPLVAAAVLGVAGVLVPEKSAEARDKIRVLIVRDASGVKVSGEGLSLHDLKTGVRLFKNTRSSSLTIEREPGSRLRVRGRSLTAQGFQLEARKTPVLINGRYYRNTLKIIPGPNRDVWVINVLPLEEYLVGLINYEISSQWTPEAIKAQVVAARTYAFYQKGARSGEMYDVDSGVSDQVYGGVGREDDRSRRAVRETGGELILHNGKPIFAVYSSCCGGKTEDGELMWSGYFPYLRAVDCAYCMDSPHFLWNYSVDGDRLGMALGGVPSSATRVVKLEIEERSQSRRVLKLAFQTENSRQAMTGKDFRRLLGYDQLRSTNFVMAEKDGSFQFSGLGWGHGVGLCQWGTKGMAEAGKEYHSILKYYYQDVEIGKTP
jgi:stage II sporulation protein D